MSVVTALAAPVASSSRAMEAQFHDDAPSQLETGDPGLELGDFARHIEFNIEEFVKNFAAPSQRLRLDTDAQICQDHLRAEGCTRGAACPYRHVRPSPKNFRPPSPLANTAHSKTVCKHWLRGLCKKGAACEFLHEYNLRKMPDCWFFAKYGYCASGDECMYLHAGPHEKRPECKGFTKGFCRLGPRCPKKHIRRVACPLFLTGFCPRGVSCPQVHPPFQLEDIDRIVEAASRSDKDLYANRDWDWPQEQGGQGRFNPQNPGQPSLPGAGRGRGRDMSNVTCHKCAQRGHLANACPNPSVPGIRGGVESHVTNGGEVRVHESFRERRPSPLPSRAFNIEHLRLDVHHDMGQTVHDRLKLYISQEAYTLVQEDGPEPQTLIVQRKTNEISVQEGAHAPTSSEKSFPVYGLLGIVSLYNSDYLIFITARKQRARAFETDIYQATDYAVYPVSPTPLGTAEWLLTGNPRERTLLGLLKAHLYGMPFYFTYGDYDLTTRLQLQYKDNKSKPLWQRADERFFYNRFLSQRLIDLAERKGGPKVDRFILPVIQGFMEIRNVNINGHDFAFGIVSRRSRHRAGTRYFRRGVNKSGQVANFNETEMVVLLDGGKTQASYLQTRGSVPLFWSEINNLRYKPDLQIRDAPETADAFRTHLEGQVQRYGDQYLINLVNSKGYEKPVKDAYERAVEGLGNPRIHYIYFDFHHQCKGLHFERVSLLLNQLDQDLLQQSYFYVTSKGVKREQSSVCRTNCMDCLDRTNVVQSQFSKWALTQILREHGVLKEREGIDDHRTFLRVFQNVWADNADVVSKAYSGTGALKTDFTRTGKRTKQGTLADGVNSAVRYIKNNFMDGPRQDAYDLFLGVWQPRTSSDQELFVDRRNVIVKGAPQLFYLALAMLFVAFFFPNINATLFGSSRMLTLLWLACIPLSLAYITSHGVEYVSWPRLDPEQNEALSYHGKGYESGKHGRTGFKLAGLPTSEKDKKRLD